MFDPYNSYAYGLIIARIVMIILSVGTGFLIGWFFSPQAKAIRLKLLIAITVIVGLIAIFDNGILGWSAASIISTVGFFVGLIWFFRDIFKGFTTPPTTFGSSRWANAHDLAQRNAFDNGGIRLGSFYHKDHFKPVSYHGDRHLLTVAPTRSGKGTTQIIPNLLSYTGSMLVIDPKGENALITAKARQDMGQDVYIVDPWGIADVEGLQSAKFNPLDWLQPHDVDMSENAMLLADSLVMPENHNDGFWIEEAKAILQGFILYVATDENEAGKRHLGRVRDLLLSDGVEMPKLFQRMAQSNHHIVRSTGARSLQKEPKLISNILATAQAQTHFLDSQRIRACTASSYFKFEDLKTKPMTIYLVLPADRLNTFGRWLRLLIQQAITVNARNIAEKPTKPVLFILDEFAALGRLTMVEQAYGLMAGFGLQIWGIIQDFNQLERIYDKGWQSFISNSGMINYFGSSDKMTAEYFSTLCGETTVWNLSTAVSKAFTNAFNNDNQSHTKTDTTSAVQRKLAYPDELMRMKDDTQLVFIETMHPLQARKVPWFEDENLKSVGINLHDQ